MTRNLKPVERIPVENCNEPTLYPSFLGGLNCWRHTLETDELLYRMERRTADAILHNDEAHEAA